MAAEEREEDILLLATEVDELVDSACGDQAIDALVVLPQLRCVALQPEDSAAKRVRSVLHDAARRIEARQGWAQGGNRKGDRPWTQIGKSIVQLWGLDEGARSNILSVRQEEAASALGLTTPKSGHRYRRRLAQYLAEQIAAMERAALEVQQADDADTLDQVFASVQNQHVRTAMISVGKEEDRARLSELCGFLISKGVRLIATPGNAKFIRTLGHEIETSWEFVRAEPIGTLRGTMHPYVLAAISARDDRPTDLALLDSCNLTPIDLVIVNSPPLQQFEELTLGQRMRLLGQIQAGGPFLLRWTIRHWESCTALVSSDDFDFAMRELEAAMLLAPRARARLFRRAAQCLAELDKDTEALLSSVWNA